MAYIRAAHTSTYFHCGIQTYCTTGGCTESLRALLWIFTIAFYSSTLGALLVGYCLNSCYQSDMRHYTQLAD